MQKISFSEDSPMAGVYRTFSHSFPELFLETKGKTKSALDKALAEIDDVFSKPEKDLGRSEVSDIFPLEIHTKFGDIGERVIQRQDNSSHNTGIQEREVYIQQGKFIIREKIGERNTLEVHQCGEYLDFPFEIDENHKRFILSQLKNRKAVLVLRNCRLEDEKNIEDALKAKFEDFRQKSVGLDHRDMSGNLHLLRNWEFMFWYLYFSTSSSQK